MTGELVALLGSWGIGRVHNDARGRLTFVYDEGWRQAPDAHPLSLSAPLAAKEHGPSVVQANMGFTTLASANGRSLRAKPGERMWRGL
jgi:HipA-like protein